MKTENRKIKFCPLINNKCRQDCVHFVEKFEEITRTMKNNQLVKRRINYCTKYGIQTILEADK